MIKGEAVGENKIAGTVSVGQARFHRWFFRVLVCNQLRVDPPGLVDLFEQEKSRIFRLPAKQQKMNSLIQKKPKNYHCANALMPKSGTFNLVVLKRYKNRFKIIFFLVVQLHFTL